MALRQAMAFASAAGLTGVVLTKLDGSARAAWPLGGGLGSRLPIRLVGAGEGHCDLRPFQQLSNRFEALLAT